MQNEGLKPCPFCGTIPIIRKNPLWRVGGQGYYGCYEFDIHCDECGCRINMIGVNTIYNTEEEAKENAIKIWNRRAK